MFAMKYLNPAGAKEGPYDTFFAGLLGGYVVFGRNPGSVSQQVRPFYSVSYKDSMVLIFGRS